MSSEIFSENINSVSSDKTFVISDPLVFRLQIHRPIDESEIHRVPHSAPGCIIQPQNSAISLLDERIQTPDEPGDLRFDEHSCHHESTRVASTSHGTMSFAQHPGNGTQHPVTDTQHPGNGSTLQSSGSLRPRPWFLTPNWGAAARAQVNKSQVEHLDDSKLTSEFFVQEKGIMQRNISTTNASKLSSYKSTIDSQSNFERHLNDTPRSHNESQRSRSPHSNNGRTPSPRSVKRKRRPLHRKRHSDNVTPRSEHSHRISEHSQRIPVTTLWNSRDSESELRSNSQGRSQDRRSEGRPSLQKTESTSKVLNERAETSTSKVFNQGSSSFIEISPIEINFARQERKSTSMEMMVSVNERKIYEIAMSGNDLLRKHLGFLKFESNDLITEPIEKQWIPARPTTETLIESSIKSRIQHSSDCVNAAGPRYEIRKKVENVEQSLTDVGHNVQKCVRIPRQCFKKRVHRAGQIMGSVRRGVSHTLTVTRFSLGPKSGSSTSLSSATVPRAASDITEPVPAPISRFFGKKSSG